MILPLITLLTAIALGQECPAGSREGDRISRGSRIRVLDVHPEDAYSENPSAVIGRIGVTTESWTSDSCWYTGSFREANGEERYFLKVAVADAGFTATTTGDVPCPNEAHASVPLDEGTDVRLVAIHREDPLYPEWVRLIGTTGSISSHTPRGSCWMSGVLTTAAGRRIELGRAAVWPTGGKSGPVAGADLSTPSPSAFEGPRVPRGQRVRIHSIDPTDAYYPERDDLVGLRCTTLEILRRQSPGLFTGEMRCDDRRTRYFLKVGLTLLPY